ncbi:MAG: carbamoyl phosphate synthase small subunit [Clostridia bacterium]|nr:carbamoyl phosphate synthase small subunit [Clostridia bacterium]
MKKAYLILQNGDVYEGARFGASGEIEAELVFTTGMIGYLETLTDPSFHGQMVMQTFPIIGSYGVIPEDFESERPRLSAYIVREACDKPSNFRSRGNLGEYMEKTGVIGLSGVDTRALTMTLREAGVMNAAIVDQLPGDMSAFTKKLAGKSLSSDVYQVSCKDFYEYVPQGVKPDYRRRVTLWDFGVKLAIPESLARLGCRVTVAPASASWQDILDTKPDGIMLSNGPGDPSGYHKLISEVSGLVGKGVPIMGICLGHQLLALAQGAKSVKLKFGHRGANQPVRRVSDGRLFVTCQNHGYALVDGSLPKDAISSYVNLDDGTNEGVDYPNQKAFSVQFHPEARSGPHDTEFLFDRFVEMMEV